MAVASWKGSIQFGSALQFAVKASATDKEIRVAFNQHHAGCGGRLKTQPGVCADCGVVLENKEDIVRGFDGTAGIDEEYLASLEREKSALMELDGLVPADQVDPRFYRRSYDLSPGKGAEKPYKLFLGILERSGRDAIGKVVMGGREAIVLVRPREGALAMELLWWPEELRSSAGLVELIAGVELSEQEMALGDELAAMMSHDFDPSRYVNEYAAAIQTYLDGFIAGESAPVGGSSLPRAVPDLADALATSLDALRPRKRKAAKPKAAKPAKRKAAA